MAHASTQLILSVIIPVHNGGDKFRRCLRSLQESLKQPDEIIVIADGDTDESWRLAKEFGTQVFRFPSPGGPGRARNCGAAQARGEVLLFIDADVTVPPQAIEMVIGAFRREPQIDACLAPMMMSRPSLIFFHNIEICSITMSINTDEKMHPRFGAPVARSAVTYFWPLVGSTKGMQDPRLKTSSWGPPQKSRRQNQVVQVSPSQAFETMEFCFDVAGRFFSAGVPMD